MDKKLEKSDLSDFNTVGHLVEWKCCETDPPRVYGYYHVFLPDLGNDDEGYGFVVVAYWEGSKASYDPPPKWKNDHSIDHHGMKPLCWSEIPNPERPFAFNDREGSFEKSKRLLDSGKQNV